MPSEILISLASHVCVSLATCIVGFRAGIRHTAKQLEVDAAVIKSLERQLCEAERGRAEAEFERNIYRRSRTWE